MVGHENLGLGILVRVQTSQPNPPKADLILNERNGAMNRSVIAKRMTFAYEANLDAQVNKKVHSI